MNELRNMVEESVDKLFADQIDRDFQISVE